MIEESLKDWIIVTLLIFFFLQIGYIMNQWNKIAELREALSRDKETIQT